MRNKFGGTCYRCGLPCAAGDGHFERFLGSFRVQHASCAIEHKGVPDAERAAFNKRRDEKRALGTGKAAQNARRRLRAAELEKASQ